MALGIHNGGRSCRDFERNHLRSLVVNNNQTAAHWYINHAQSGLQSLESPFDLLRTTMPPDVAPPFIAPYNTVSDVFGLDRRVARRIDLNAATKVVLRHDGTPVEVSPVTRASLSMANRAVDLGNGATVSATPTGPCISGPPGSYVAVPLDGDLRATDLFFGLQYSSSTRAHVRMVMVDSVGGQTYNWFATELPAGVNKSRFDRLEGTDAHQMLLTFDGGVADLCLSGLWLGQIRLDQGPAGCAVLTQFGDEGGRVDQCDAPWPLVS